jgi:hypothetical protein
MAEATGRRFRLVPTAKAMATVLGALMLVLAASSVALAYLAHDLTARSIVPPIIILIYAVVGVVVARHQPRNPVGRILLIAMVLFVFSSQAGSYALLHYRLGHRGLPLAPVAVLLEPSWVLAVTLFPLVILLFPDGRLTSRRQGRAARLAQ